MSKADPVSDDTDKAARGYAGIWSDIEPTDEQLAAFDAFKAGASHERSRLLGEVERLTEAAELRKQVKDDAIAQMNVWAKAAEKAEQARDAALAFHDAWVECEVAMATGSPDLFREKRSRLIALHRALSPSDRIEPTPEERKD
jgi:hypothetical protein